MTNEIAASTAPTSKPKRQTPESVRYDELKGKRVAVMLPRSCLAGVLRWVDKYTIGVHVLASTSTGRDQVWIVNKAHIVRIGEA